MCAGQFVEFGEFLDAPIGESGMAAVGVLKRTLPRLGVSTVRDLLFHLPRRYEDLREMHSLGELQWGVTPDGEVASARATVDSIAVQPTFRPRVQRTVLALMKGLAVVRSDRASTVASLVKHGASHDAAEQNYTDFAHTMSPTAVTSDADQTLELHVRAAMLGMDPKTLPPASNFFDFSFVKEAAAQLKKENWKP